MAQEVIAGRTQAADFYSSQVLRTKAEVESDQRHRHFILVLQKIHNLLREAKASAVDLSTSSHGRKPRTACKTPALANLFEILELEESDYTTLSTKATKKNATSSHARVLAAATMQVDRTEEKWFKFWCFLTDMREIHDFALDAWCDWQAGDLSLDVAAMVTDIGAEIISAAHFELSPKHNEFIFYQDAVSLIRSQVEPNSAWSSRTPLDDNNAGHNVSDELEHMMPVAGRMAISICDHWPSINDNIKHEFGAEPQKQARYVHPVVAHEDFSFHPFAEALWAMLPDLCRAVRRGSIVNQRTAELISGPMEMEHVKGVTLAFVNTLQMYLNVFELIGDQWHEAFSSEKQESCAPEVDQSLPSKFHKILSNYIPDLNYDSTRSQSSNHPVDTTASLLRAGGHQASSQKLQEYEEASVHMPVNLRGPVGFCKTLPVWFGNTFARQKIIAHSGGLGIVNTDEFVLTSAHLYRCMRQMNMLDHPWPDMDWFIEAHSRKCTFVQDVPSHRPARSFAAHFGLALGIPASFFSSMQDECRLRGTSSGKACKMKSGKMRPIESPSDFCRESYNFVREASLLQAVRGDPTSVALQKILARKEASSSDKRKNARSVNYTMMQLLRCYKTARIEDELTMNFDYVSFWIVCQQFLDEVRTTLEKRKSDGFMPGSGFVMEIFIDLCIAESAGTLEHCQLAAAAAVADPYIRAVGGKYTALARARAEGKRQTTPIDVDQVPEACNQTADEEASSSGADGKLPPFMTRAQVYDLAENVRRLTENRPGRRGRRA
ncbi:hypothetical protein Slin15195_G074310 [Septoria linicola]|uniref:DUF6604 domain-containing protein n=1 Tax=Septoria linicola TaxID=215465 RepID=A0A9Q9AQZ2_9PEZI|nr:hypothetical protein Slin15195_G074310 [Septoria linicola]